MLSFCPLKDLSSSSKRVRAEQFIEELVTLQNIMITPEIRAAIHTTILSLAHDEHSHNLTIFCSMVQHAAVRAALQYYTLAGQINLLDSAQDTLQSSHLQTFEMNWLLAQKAQIYLPVLRYIFDHIATRLETSQQPTLIILEEAWLYIAHEIFAKKLQDWLKTLRKKNARVIFATQSLADLYDPASKNLTATTAVIMESCPTKVYLPNLSAETETKTLYQKMGLSARQIAIITQLAIPKHHYYVVTPVGNRLIELGFNAQSMALAFIGLSQEKSQALLACKNKYNSAWPYYWLQQQGFMDWAEYWHEHYFARAEHEKNI
jgi:type IV secretion system protein VirB4